MKNNIKKSMIICILMGLTMAANTHCMLLLQKKLPKNHLRSAIMRRRPIPRFYNAGAEIHSAQILVALENQAAILKQIQRDIQAMKAQSLQKPITTPVTTIGSAEADYSYNPATNACNKYQRTTESDVSSYKELKERDFILYGNR